jgi:hypothetical protein
MAQASTGLVFHEYGIANILTQYQLTIPVNQRSYAWTEEYVKTLLSDLTKSFHDGEDIYFLGMIVLTGSGAQWEVADGQQRLATASIIIAAVRDYLLDLDDLKTANKYQNMYLLEYEERSGEYRPKLRLNYEDNDFFIKTILKPPSEREEYTGRKFGSHDRLRAAVDIVKNHINNLTLTSFQANDKRTRLYDWMDFLQKSARAIVIEVPGLVGSVFKLFETLNARGLTASQTDILKNYLFDKGKDRLADLQTSWTSMVSTIDEIGEDDLLINYIRHYWIVHHGPTTARELGDNIQEAIKSERQAVDTVKALDSFASDYIALLMPREHPQFNEFSNNTRNCIYTITNELKIAQILPLLLAIKKYLPKEEAERAFRLCLSWCVRFLICGGGGGGFLDRHYGLRAMEISTGEIKTAKELSNKMVTKRGDDPIVPSDAVFRANFEVANVKKTHLQRYYLRAIDLHLAGEKYPQFVPNEDTKAVNIEHVLPVVPSSDWNVPADIAESYYKRIGNMCLMGSQVNVKIGNKTFQEKKPFFKDSPFLTTQEIATYEKWGPEEIKDRQEKLANLAPKVWPI